MDGAATQASAVTETPTTAVTTTTVPTNVTSLPPTPSSVEYVIDIPSYPTITLSAPADWERVQDWAIARDKDTESWLAMSFWSVVRGYGNPCEWSGSLFQPGFSVEELAQALAEVPMRDASSPEPVSVGGMDGLCLEWSVPNDIDFAACDEGYFESWTGVYGGSDRYQQAPGQVDRLWILDVDGQRLVIDTFYFPPKSGADIVEIDAILDSIEFGQ